GGRNADRTNHSAGRANRLADPPMGKADRGGRRGGDPSADWLVGPRPGGRSPGRIAVPNAATRAPDRTTAATDPDPDPSGPADESQPGGSPWCRGGRAGGACRGRGQEGEAADRGGTQEEGRGRQEEAGGGEEEKGRGGEEEKGRGGEEEKGGGSGQGG